MTLKTSFRAASFAAQAALLCCVALPWDDPFEQYLQRKNGVELGAGNAKAINSATHVGDPWAWYSRYTRMPANGERISGAIERYRDVSKLPNAPKPIGSVYESTTSIQAK